jgi:hypothetical protein
MRFKACDIDDFLELKYICMGGLSKKNLRLTINPTQQQYQHFYT